MNQKISITPDELESPEVEAKLRERAENQQAPPSGEAASVDGFSQIIYNILVYTALFGLAGGLFAGVVGELFFFATRTPLDTYQDYLTQTNELNELWNEGEITDAEYDRQFEKISQKYESNPFVRADIEQFDWIESEEFDYAASAPPSEDIERLSSRYTVRSLVFAVMWFCSVGMTLAVFLSIADPVMSQNNRGIIVNGSVAAAIGLAGSFMGFFIASVVYNQLGGGDGDGSLVLQVLARALGWGVIGGFLAVAPGIAIRNLKRSLIGLVGGVIGGTLGGALFDPIAIATSSVEVSRIVAVLAIGGLTGLGSGLLESAAKTAWVRVLKGLIAGKQFIMYRETTTIGSSPQCDIYLFKDPSINPRHAAIHKKGNRFEIEHLGSSTDTIVNGEPVTRAWLKKGDRIQIGDTLLVFMMKNKG